MTTYVVGAGFHPGAQQAVDQLRLGEELVLRREPDNAHDRNAVAVLDVCGQMLGYVPRQDAPSVAKALDSGWSVNAIAMRRGRNMVQITWERDDDRRQCI